MNFYSHSGEDKWIVDNFRLPERGVMVEVGAGRWDRFSNSLHFEQRGWDVILIEPNPELHPELEAKRKARLFKYACGDHDGETLFTLEREPTLSGIARKGERRVILPMRTLTSIMEEAGVTRINVLSIDTEGTELEVWKAFDMRKYRPSVVILEYSTMGLDEKPIPILERFLADGYSLAHIVGGNFIFTTFHQDARKQ